MAVATVRSTDVGAPVLSGQNGALVAVLTYALPLLGWTVQWTAANRAVYLQGVGSSGFGFGVLDDGSGAGGAKEALIRGGETWSDAATFVNGFPTAAQLAGGCFLRKSTSADATARAWSVFGDSRTAILKITTGDGGSFCAYMGDFLDWVTGALYGCCLIADGATGASIVGHGFAQVRADLTLGGMTGHFIARAASGAVGAVASAKAAYLHQSSGYLGGTGGGTTVPWVYPCPLDNSGHYSELVLLESNYNPRGVLRGVLAPQCSYTAAPADGTVLTGPSGENLEVINPLMVSTSWCVVQTSGSW